MAMSAPRPVERWIVMAAGVVVLLCVGSIYSWSLYTRPLIAFFGWSSVQVALTFAIATFALGTGALLGGYLHDRYGPSRVAAAGVALWGAGNLLAGLGLPAFGLPWLYATYGVIAGFGAGIAYIVPSATVTKWFPEERGLANGVIMLGFGSASLLFNSIVSAIPAFAKAAADAGALVLGRNGAIASGVAHVPSPLASGAAAADVHAVLDVLVWSGAIFIVVGSACAMRLHPPPPGYAVAAARAMLARERQLSPHEILRAPIFYSLWLIMFVDAFAGLALVCNAVPVYAELTGVDAAVAGVTYGWLSIFNGVGRLLWAWLSDRLGRMRSLAFIFFTEGVALATLVRVHSPLGVGLAFAVFLLCFAGVFGIMPAVAADFFGTRYIGEDYGLLLTAASVAGLLGPVLTGLMEDATGSLTGALTPIAVLLVAASVLPPLAARRRAAGAARAASS
jgi:MFS family permease